MSVGGKEQTADGQPDEKRWRVDLKKQVEKIMLTVKEFARVSGIGERKVRELTRIDGFPSMRSGVKIMIHQERAAEWLAEYAVHHSDRTAVMH